MAEKEPIESEEPKQGRRPYVDRELEEYRSLMEVPSTFEDGFNRRTIIGALFICFIMIPSSIYLGLVAGVGISAAAEWVTIILFTEVARRSFQRLTRQEVYILFYVAAALTTMVSTTITCLDAYPRVMRSATQGLMPRLQRNPKSQTSLYWFWIVIVTAGTLLLMSLLKSSMAFMVDLATTISFVTAPALAILNYRVIMHTHVPAGARPRRWLRIYAVVGIVFLSAFSLFYILWRLFIH